MQEHTASPNPALLAPPPAAAEAAPVPLAVRARRLLGRVSSLPRPRFSALNLSLGFIAISFVALAAFAAPLWYAWKQAIEQGRVELLREEAVWLTDMFQKLSLIHI